MKILVASSNAHKLQEMRDILADADLDIIGLGELSSSVPPPLETGETFEANAAEKALYYARQAGMPAIADDSGLVVDALDGAPGLHSARWMGEDTPYTVKNRALIERLQGLEGEARSARFVCVAALAWPDGRVVTARGEHEGRIHHEIQGEGGFGYDPVFFSPEAGQTFGTLTAEQKRAISHRGRALAALRAKMLEALHPGPR